MQLLGHLFEYELARRGEELNILGATSGDTGSAAEYAMRGKQGVRVFMLSPARPHEPVPAGADVQPAGRQHPQHRRRRRVRRLPGHRQGASATTSTSSAGTASAPSTRSTGRGCWRRWSTTSRATSRPRSRTTQQVSFAVPIGQLRQHLRRPRGAHDGPADRPPGAGHQREQRARRVLPHRHLPRAQQRRDARDQQPVDGHQQGQQLRALRLRPARPRCRAHARTVRRRRWRRDGGFTLTPRRIRAGIADGFGFVSGSSTHADRLATIRDTWQRWQHDDRHPHRRRPEGGARAPAAGRADDRAGNRAAGQVRGHHRRGAGRAARAAAGAARHRGPAPALHA